MDKDEVLASQKFTTRNPIEILEGDDETCSISPQLINKLRDVGYHSLESIVVLGAQQVSNDIHTGLESSQRICGLASMKLRNFARTNEDSSSNYLGNQCGRIHIKTGSKVLDHYLGGGIELGAVTEFFGKSASGKTQLCHTISVTSQISYQRSYLSRNINEGISSKVVYIDTEGTFRHQRIDQISRARGLKSEEIMKNINPLECYSIFEQEQCLKYICELLDKDKSISLIIIDSIIVHFRTEYSGRSCLPERQQRLNRYLNTLSKIARIYKVAVVITNQVQSNLSDNPYSNNSDSPSGGNILGYVSTHRIRLNRPFEQVYAKFVKSPYQSSSFIDVRFTITEKGIDDLRDELNILKL